MAPVRPGCMRVCVVATSISVSIILVACYQPEPQPEPQPESQPQPPATKTSPAPRNAPAQPGHDYLVWQETESNFGEPPRYQTTWLHVDEQGVKVEGVIDSLLLSEGEHVYVYMTENHESEPSDDPFELTIFNESVKLVAPDGVTITIHEGGANPPDPMPSDACFYALGSEHVLTGNVGPYLFARDRDYAMRCGSPHGGYEASTELIDLRTGKAVELTWSIDKSQLGAALPEIHAKILLEDSDYFDLEESPMPKPEDIEVTALRPKLTGGPRVELEHQLTVETCYACSDYEWSSYTLSVLHSFGTEAPAKLREHLEVPPAVQAHVDPLIGDNHARGFTTVATEAALRELHQLIPAKG